MSLAQGSSNSLVGESSVRDQIRTNPVWKFDPQESQPDPEGKSSHGTTIPYGQRNVWKGAIRPGKGWIEKGYGDAPLLFRLYGRFCLFNEKRALERLKGIGGVPLFLGRLSRDAIKMTRLQGTPLEKFKRGDLTELCFERLREVIDRIHGRGVAHGDLHMRNILVHEEEPSIIDFSNAYVRGSLPVLDEGFFRLFVQLDLHCLFKVEKKFFEKGKPPRMFYLYRLVKGRK
jgi:hypothetical protein